MVIDGTALDMNSSELSWALTSLVARVGEHSYLGNLRELGWMIETQVGTYGDKIVTAYIPGLRKSPEIWAGTTITCENDQKKFVDALAPKLGVPRSMRAVLLSLHEVEA